MKAYHWRPILEAREAAKREPPPDSMQAEIKAKVQAQTTQRAPPLCVDCKFHSVTFDWVRGKALHWCYSPLSRNPVTGAATDPSINRRDKLDCGPYGSHWEVRPAPPPRPRVERAVDESEPMEYEPPVPFLRLQCRPADDVVAVLWQPGVEVVEHAL